MRSLSGLYQYLAGIKQVSAGRGNELAWFWFCGPAGVGQVSLCERRPVDAALPWALQLACVAAWLCLAGVLVGAAVLLVLVLALLWRQ